MINNLKTFPITAGKIAEKWNEDFMDSLRLRLETLEADAIKYVDCEFNAPQFRAGMIQQLKDILGDVLD